MAIIGLIYQKRGTDAIALAAVLALTIIPVFIINPFAGVYVDRWDKRKTMFYTDFLRGILMLIIAIFIIKLNNLIPFYVLIFILFSIGRFFIPAKMSIIPGLIEDKKDIFLANSLISTTATFAAMLGFGIGGILVENWGAKGGFIIDGITFFLSSIFILLISTKYTKGFRPKDIIEISKKAISIKPSVIRELKEGIKYIFTHKGTLFSIKSLSVLFSALGSLYITVIIFIQSTLKTGVKDLGLIIVWLGVGILLGSLIYGRIAQKFSLTKTINFMLFISSLALIGFAVTIKKYPSGVLACILSLGIGTLLSPIIVGANSLIHNQSRTELWGRIFSSQEVIIHFFFIIFYILSSLLTKLFSAFTIIIFTGIILAVLSLSLFIPLIINPELEKT